MTTLEWDNLRYVLAVARGGSAAAAARQLGVTYATVLRHVQAAEQQFGLRLFERGAGGYAVSEPGRALVAMAESVESAITDTHRSLSGQSTELRGVLRFTTTETLMDSLLPPLLKSFGQRHPAIQLELVVSNAVLSLDKRAADVTVRSSASPPPALVGMRLARLGFALYASPAYLERAPDAHWSAMDWLLADGELSHAPIGRWLREAVPAERVVLRADSFIALRRMASAGLGVTALPCFLGRASPDLRCVADAPEVAASELWILTHADLRQSARVRAFMDHMARGLRAQRKLLEDPAAPA